MMKSVLMRMAAFAMVLLSVSACKDKDEPAGPNNNFTLDGSVKSIESGFLFYETSPSVNDKTGVTYYRNDIYFVDKGLLTDQSTTTFDNKGKGNTVTLEIVSSTENLEVGVYNFTGTDANPAPFDFWDGDVILNYDPSGQTADKVYRFIEGKLTVTKENDNFVVSVDGKVQEAPFETHPIYGFSIDLPDPSKTPLVINVQYHGVLTKIVGD